jgi:hypothetical protein
MCRVLVLNKINLPFELHDVIHIIEDGQAFGKKERPPHFKIVEFPGTPASDLLHLLQELQEQPKERIKPSFRRMRRLARLMEKADRKTLLPCRYRLNPETLKITDKQNAS